MVSWNDHHQSLLCATSPDRALETAPSNHRTSIEADGTLKDVVKVKLSSNLAVSLVYDKRATFVSCSSIRQSQLNTAAYNVRNTPKKPTLASSRSTPG